jgi:hypothetical protein
VSEGPPTEAPDGDTTGEALVIGAILSFILGLLTVGIVYFVLVQLNLVGLEPPEPLRYLLLTLIPASAVGYFWLMRRWLVGW